MKHVNIYRINGKCIHLVPESGYMLIDDRTQVKYSEAFVRPSELKYFREERNGEEYVASGHTQTGE